MDVLGIVGASALRKSGFIVDLVSALRIEGLTLSTIKRAPDGFDMDTPGKSSYARREAGCREVVLVGDRRLVLMQEFGSDPEPSLDALLTRLQPVDLVIAEGFKSASLPTIEVCLASSGRTMHWPNDPKVIAVVSDTKLDTTLPQFAIDDVADLAAFVAAKVRAGQCSTRAGRGAD